MVDPTRAIGPEGVDPRIGPSLEPEQAAPSSARSFKALLSESMAEVNRLQQDADNAIIRLQTGQGADLTQVMVAVEKADLAFKTLMQIRNKLVEAYKQIEQMRL